MRAVVLLLAEFREFELPGCQLESCKGADATDYSDSVIIIVRLRFSDLAIVRCLWAHKEYQWCIVVNASEIV